ncbi:MAG: bifunctional folylpolyglutamate synthase/dihydrofolate synthase [Alphaproteobacteria bacterium]|nr:bifunctional folylpolyglutamate synthase/dihydrofolate synthase [Alphaproteobacteria bacterium]
MATESSPDTAQAINTLLARFVRYHPDRIELSLDRMCRLLSDLGDPHTKLPPVIHIAGTNGKGSTAAFLRTALEASGKTVSAYTSPHLIRFAERYRIAGAVLADSELLALFEEIEERNAGQSITEFEITTAAAFLAISRAEADIAILEVGLGGRCDATNVVERPLATIITRVAMDHMNFLGDTLRDIAGEKAAIQKPDVPSIIGPQDKAAMDMIAAAATSTGAPLYRAGFEWSITPDNQGNGGTYHRGERDMSLPPPALPGRHQLDNAATAAACLDICGLSGVTDETIAAGLREARWPGRLEKITQGPFASQLPESWQLWCDAAHNPSGAAAAAAMFRELATANPRHLHLVLAMQNDKNCEGFLAPFQGLATSVTTIPLPDEPRMHAASKLAEIAQTSGFSSAHRESLPAALRSIVSNHSPGHILITGSHLLVGLALSLHNSAPLDR